MQGEELNISDHQFDRHFTGLTGRFEFEISNFRRKKKRKEKIRWKCNLKKRNYFAGVN